MAYFLRGTKRKNGDMYYQIYDSYYSQEHKKNMNRSIRKLGLLSDLRKEGESDEQCVERLRAEVKELDDKRKKSLAATIDGRGISFRQMKDGSFHLFRVTSKKEEGKSYPVLIQEYLGSLSEKEGFIPAKRNASSPSPLVEIGLSHFIWENFKRELNHFVFNSGPKEAETKIRAAIVLFLYGRIDPVTLSLSSISIRHEEEITKVGSSRSVSNLRSAIKRLLEERIADETDREDLILILRQSLTDSRSTEFRGYPEKAVKIMERWGNFQ